MRIIAEKHGYLKKPKKCLTYSYFGKKILLITPLAQFYLQQGLVITRIYEFVQFYPEECYENLAKSIVSDRRLADLELDKKVLAFSQKLLGSSLYSTSL